MVLDTGWNIFPLGVGVPGAAAPDPNWNGEGDEEVWLPPKTNEEDGLAVLKPPAAGVLPNPEGEAVAVFPPNVKGLFSGTAGEAPKLNPGVLLVAAGAAAPKLNPPALGVAAGAPKLNPELGAAEGVAPKEGAEDVWPNLGTAGVDVDCPKAGVELVWPKLNEGVEVAPNVLVLLFPVAPPKLKPVVGAPVES